MPDADDLLKMLDDALIAQQRAIQLPSDYYAGNHRLLFATAKFRNTFGSLFRAFSDNWCRTVVDASVERLVIDGFRIGKATTADEDARRIWQANNLDAESLMLHTEAGIAGCGYIMVSPASRDGDVPLVTVEHASQVIVLHAPGNRRRRLAALKKWRGDDRYDYAALYLPDYVHQFRSVEKVSRGASAPRTRGWSAAEGSGPNALGVVPVIPLYNNPRMLGGGQSDLDTAIPLQDAINKQVADMLIASEFVAHPQRYATGVEVPTIEQDGKQLPDPAFEITTSVSRLLVSEDPGAKFGQLEGADLAKYVQPISMLLQHLAAQTRTPPHYLLGQIVNASGDALKAAETGLVAKVKRKQIDFGEAWEEAIRLALRLQGKATGDEASIETIWRDPEYRSFGELVDGLTKLSTIGVPNEVLWEKAGFTQVEIDRMREAQEADEFLGRAAEQQQAAMMAEAARREAAAIPADAGTAAVA